MRTLILILGCVAAQAAILDVCPSGCTYGTIQAAIDAWSPGDIVEPAPGTYVEALTIAGNKDGFVLRSREWRRLPPAGVRINPLVHGPLLVKIRLTTQNTLLAIGTASGPQPDNVSIRGIWFEWDGPTNPYNMVTVGTNLQHYSTEASGVVFRHCVCTVPAENPNGSTRCFRLAGGLGHKILDSHVAGMKARSDLYGDSQAVQLVNVANVEIKNNYLEGASENLLLGGEDSFSLTNEFDILIEGNDLRKPGYMMYRSGSGAPSGPCYYGDGSGMFYRRTDVTQTCAGGACYRCQSDGTWALATGDTYRAYHYTPKNLLELKRGERVTVRGNYFRGSFCGSDGSQCWGVSILALIGSGAGGSYSRLVDVLVENNWIDQSYRGINFGNGWATGTPNTFDARPVVRGVLRNNLITNMGRYPAMSQWPPGDGPTRNCLVYYSGADGMRVENNTCRAAADGNAANSISVFDGAWSSPLIADLWVRNNLVRINGTSAGFRMDSVLVSSSDCSPTGMGVFVSPLDATKRVDGNAFFGGDSSNDWIQGASCTSTIAGAQTWVASDAAADFATDHRLNPTSPLIAAGTSSTVPGADVDAVMASAGQAANTVPFTARRAIQAWRSGNTVSVRLTDQASACTIRAHSSVSARKTPTGALTPSSDGISLRIRRTVSWTSASAAYWLIECDGETAEGVL